MQQMQQMQRLQQMMPQGGAQQLQQIGSYNVPPGQQQGLGQQGVTISGFEPQRGLASAYGQQAGLRLTDIEAQSPSPAMLRPMVNALPQQGLLRPQQLAGLSAPRPYGGGAGFAKPLPPPPSSDWSQTGAGGGAGAPPTSWKMSIEPMAYGGMIPGYQEGGWLTRQQNRLNRAMGMPEVGSEEFIQGLEQEPLTGGEFLANFTPSGIIGGLSRLKGLASLFGRGRGAASTAAPIRDAARLLGSGTSAASRVPGKALQTAGTMIAPVTSAASRIARPLAGAGAAAALLSTQHARDDSELPPIPYPRDLYETDEADLDYGDADYMRDSMGSILDRPIPKRDMSASLVDTSMLDRDISIPD